MESLSDDLDLEVRDVALLFREHSNDYEVLIPHGDGDFPDKAAALVACACRLVSDPAFFNEQVTWLKSQAGKSVQ